MEKKSGNRWLAVLIYGVVLSLVTYLVSRWAWTGIPLGLVCVCFPQAAWMVSGGFIHPSDKPSFLARNRLRKVGFFLMIIAIAKIYSSRLLGV